MQKIFYNAKLNISTKNNEFDAFLINDGSFVFVGDKDEVLSMKTEDTEIVDLKSKEVYPAFFCMAVNLYDLVEERLKNAKKFKNIENPDDFDEDFEKFDNYEVYKKEFLKIQTDLLNKGISTVQELNMLSKEFTFWKKMSDEKQLKIDIVGYVDIKKAKNVMDNNCRSYRKYKNGFRLGGYSISLDGDLHFKQACLRHCYKNGKGFKGCLNFYDEELSYIIKTAFEEKKQLVIETNGDEAVNQFLRCFEEVKTKEKVEDVFRPVALKCNLLTKKQIQKMKQLQIIPAFLTNDLLDYKNELIYAIGKSKLKKLQPLAVVDKLEHEFMLQSSKTNVMNGFDIINQFYNIKNLSKIQRTSYEKLLKSIYKTNSYIFFDEVQKGSIENGKRADFIVVDKDKNIKEFYILGEKIKK